jgi:Zn-dependent peptidase ImmA (M78 family)/transcriptional regulator with XRE-family HTH domain
MLALARESRGHTQIELARLLSISQAYVSKIESDLLEPSADVLARIAEVLDYPESFFFLTDPIYGPGVTEFWHRKRKAATARQMRRIYAEINKRIIHVERLLRAAELPESFYRFDVEEFDGPADVARAVRSAWHLPPGPVVNLVQAVEAAGGLVIRCEFGTRLVDAVSRWVPGLPPMFFTNADLPADRERLTLAHEIGHIVMHRAPSPTMEEEAFDFAAELLTPAAEIAPYLEQPTLPRLASLKPMWKVSIAALITRAARLELIPERQARYLWMQMGRAGYREREPAELDFPKEEPTLLRDLFALHRSELHYSIEDLAGLLAIHAREVASIYPVMATVAENRSAIHAL